MKYFIYLLFLYCSYASSYPQFIGHGYNACITCHMNPYGNGPLSDYGRALSATLISDRVLHPIEKTEEEIGANSSFLYMKEFNKTLKPSIDYRGLYLDRNVDKNDAESDFINMQADLNLLYIHNPKVYLSLTYGYAPKPRSQSGEDVETNRSREHYIAYKFNENLGLYTGLLDKVFGIRTADHIAFSKQTTGLAQNDQSHGVLFHYNSENIELGIHSFIGNLDQDQSLRQKGLSLKLESNVNNKFKPGFSILESESDFYSNRIFSIHSKSSLSRGSSILFELGKHQTKNLLNNEITKSTFVFLQSFIKLRRGTYFFLTTEYFKPSDVIEYEITRLGPGIQYFLHQGVELRLDLYNTKTFNPDAATKDTFDFTAQVHLWF